MIKSFHNRIFTGGHFVQNNGCVVFYYWYICSVDLIGIKMIKTIADLKKIEINLEITYGESLLCSFSLKER